MKNRWKIVLGYVSEIGMVVLFVGMVSAVILLVGRLWP